MVRWHSEVAEDEYGEVVSTPLDGLGGDKEGHVLRTFFFIYNCFNENTLELIELLDPPPIEVW